jgi:hypothetical protein
MFTHNRAAAVAMVVVAETPTAATVAMVLRATNPQQAAQAAMVVMAD